MNSNEKEFGISYVISEIRTELKDIMLAVKSGNADVSRIQRDVQSLNGRVNVLESLYRQRKEIEQKQEDRVSELRLRLIERVLWGVMLSIVAFGAKVVGFFKGL